MKFLTVCKDGGPESTVTAIEIKSLFSIMFLKFEGRSRDVFHTHAFNCISWLLKGRLTEWFMDYVFYDYYPSWRPIRTYRHTRHKVDSDGTSWVFTIRGPWLDGNQTLTHGRKVVL